MANSSSLDETILDRLRAHAQTQPDRLAYRFLRDDGGSETLTFGQLDRRVRGLAARLREHAAPGDRALLLYPPGLEFVEAFLACLAAQIIAVPAYPPRRNRKAERLQAIAEDARPCLILTTRQFLPMVQTGELGNVNGPISLATDDIDVETDGNRPLPNIAGDTVAFLQYTSGSTGTPRGVIISHANLTANERAIQAAFRHTPDSVFVNWLPVFHDMGLIGNLLQPLFVGFPSVLLAPSSFLQEPVRWLRAITEYRATTAGGPNFTYDHCVRNITEEQKSGLDLRSWAIAYNGAEPVRAETLDRFAAAFGGCGFRREAFFPCYGLAEATLFVSGGPAGEEPRRRCAEPSALEAGQVVAAEPSSGRWLVGCGRLAESTKVVAVDPATGTVVPDGRVGELWVSGPGVAAGYWGRDEETRTTFGNDLASGEGPYLNTGDLGFLHGGEVFVTGRSKDLIIIRGRNIYPQDVEAAVARVLPFVQANSCAAFAVEENGPEQLGIVIEADRELVRIARTAAEGNGKAEAAVAELASIVGKVRQAITDQFDLPIHAVAFVRPGSFPRTSSGKVQRRACRDGLLNNTFEIVHALLRGPGVPMTADGRPSTADYRPRATGMLDPAASRVKTDEITRWLRDYSGRRLNSRIIDERRCVPPYVVLDFGLRGLFGLQVPTSEGGLGLTNADTLRVLEQLAAIDLTLCLMVGNHNGLGTRTIQRFGQQPLKADLLPLLASGRQLAAFALSEPGAGSNPLAIQTVARRVSGGWIVRGEKKWIGLASWAGVITTFAKTVGADGQIGGIIALAVREDAAGLRQGPEALTTGIRGIVQNTVFFDDVFVPDGCRLGEPGEGMGVAQDAMMFCRLALASFAIGGMKRCAQLVSRYAARRMVGTGRLLDNPVTLTKLKEMLAATAALEALAYEIAEWLDTGREVPQEAYVACKTTGPELLWQTADSAVQLLGGRGFTEPNVVPRILRDARVLRIFEGPTETLNHFLGSSLLQRGDGVRRLIADGFGQAGLAAELYATVERIRSGTGSGSPLLRSACAVGEVASAAILAAAARKRSAADAFTAEAARWAAERFASMQEAVLAEVARPLLSASNLLDQISNFTAAIGDLEQTLPGEEDQLDPLLAKSECSNVSLQPQLPDARVISEGVASSAVTPIVRDPLVAATRSALVKWLRSEVNPRLEDVDEDTQFATLGLDSVGAASIAMDIEKATGVRLTAEVIHEYPTIKLLAGYIGNRILTQQLHANQATEKRDRDERPKLPLDRAHNPPLPDPLDGSLADFSGPSGPRLKERLQAYTAWRTCRREAGVWPFYRLARSPAAPDTIVTGEDGISRQCINYASQDYLGLARDPRVLRKVQEAIVEHGVHSAGSPALLGTTAPMADLERTLAAAIGKEDCLVFPTGWAAGFGVVTGLVRAHDTLVLDSLCHRCLMDGAYHVSRQPLLFHHNDLDHLRQTLRQARERDPANGLFVVAESLYSMDSDSPDLPALVQLVREFNAILILDVAHDFGSMGARGLGLLEQLDGTGLAVDVVMGSFSKTFAATGGFVAAERPVADYLRGHTSPFVFSNAISPVQAAVALECCTIAFSAEGRQLRDRLNDNVLALRSAMQAAGCRVAGIPSPIVPVFVGGEREARLTAREIARTGLLANLVEYPAVPLGRARFRFQVMSTHTPETCREAAALFAGSLPKTRARRTHPS